MTALLVWICDQSTGPYGTCARRAYLSAGETAAPGWLVNRDGTHRCPDHNPARRAR